MQLQYPLVRTDAAESDEALRARFTGVLNDMFGLPHAAGLTDTVTANDLARVVPIDSDVPASTAVAAGAGAGKTYA